MCLYQINSTPSQRPKKVQVKLCPPLHFLLNFRNFGIPFCFVLYTLITEYLINPVNPFCWINQILYQFMSPNGVRTKLEYSQWKCKN